MANDRQISPQVGRDGDAAAAKQQFQHGDVGGAARRALMEAEARRRRMRAPAPREIGGREGPDPVRYGDWEVNGLASDF